ncbi:MAG: hypothetical protein JO119_11745 [Acidobacteria bacterium]|nr:hypothetical protein [Acidobacteriota bacterium]
MKLHRSLSLSLPLLALAASLSFGCNKSANQPAASTSPDASAPAGSAPASGPSGAAAAPDSSAAMKQAAPVPPPKPLVIPAGTIISVTLDQPVGSKISTPGSAFAATVAAPISIDGRLAIPKGAHASGVVKDAKPAGRFKGGAVLSLTLTNVSVKNEAYEIATSAPTETSTGKGKRTAALAGGGAGGGALIGGLAGGGKGALIGGLIGAAAGTGGAGFTGNRDLTLAAETLLNFKLVQPIEIKNR